MTRFTLLLTCLCLTATVAAAQTSPSRPSPVDLAPVVVTANRAPTPASEVAASVTVIDSAQIADSGATDLSQVLRDVAGLQVIPYGPAGSLSTVSLRGSESDQVLILLDGVRLNSPQNGLFDLSALPVPLSDIDRIEVVRGPASTLYGSSAVGGVIQIFTKKATPTPSARVDLSTGSNDTRSAGFSVSQQKGPFSYAVSADRDHSLGYRTNSALDQNRLDGRFSLELPADFSLQLRAYHLQKDIGVPGPVTSPSLLAHQKDGDTYLTMELKGPAGPWHLSLRTVYDRLDNRYRDPQWSTDTHSLVQTRGVEVHGNVELGIQRLTLGGEAYRDSLSSTSISGNHQQTRWAGYGQDTIVLPAKAVLELGVRYDANSDFSNEASPRAALILPVTSSTRLRLSVGRSYRAPTLNDRFWSDPWDHGNPDLKPEMAWEYELGIEQQLGAKGRLSLAGFRRDVRDLIQWQSDQNYIWSPQNIGRARIWGGEAELSYRLVQWMSVGGTYTYLLPRDLTSGGIVANKARNQLTGSLDFGPWRQTRLHLEGRYATFYPQFGRTCSGYAVFDAALSHTFSVGDWSDLELTLAVKNLLDRKYQVNPGYPMPPLTWQLGL
ncbi:MAG TPA: TonB-dependent receptor, partial [Desulfuromonadales bacterium]|nr:TonB-dependent receptor [Desulfuromonadales bacterium]